MATSYYSNYFGVGCASLTSANYHPGEFLDNPFENAFLGSWVGVYFTNNKLHG